MDMDKSINLSIEQEFNLKLFSDQVQQLTHEQTKALLIETNRQMTIRDNLYRDLLKQYMGIGSEPMPL